MRARTDRCLRSLEAGAFARGVWGVFRACAVGAGGGASGVIGATGASKPKEVWPGSRISLRGWRSFGGVSFTLP